MDPGSGDKKPVKVSIYNQTYTLLSSGDAAETEELAHMVDDLMHNIANRAANVDATRAAVLACLHLADRLRLLERELAGLRLRVDSKSRQFSLMLDQVVGPAG